MNASPHVWRDFGWWRDPNGQRRLLSWNEHTEELKFWSLHRWDDDEVLCRFSTERAVAERLERCHLCPDTPKPCPGWPAHHDDPDALKWLADRLEGC